MKNFYFINEQRGGGNPPAPQPKKSNFTKVNITEKDVCDGSKEVTKGMRGDIVGYIQTALKTILKLKDEDFIDDRFGENTKKAVVNYQLNNKDKGLTVSGKVDKDTFDLLFKGTSMACTKEDKPTEVEPVVDTTEVKPTNVKKPIKFSDVISPQKYKVKIREQVEYGDISQGISSLKGRLGGNTSNKTTTNQVATTQQPVNPTPQEQPQPKTEDPVQILKRVINTGCIDKLKKEIGFELYGRPEAQPTKLRDGKYAITGINATDREKIYLYADGTGLKVKVDDESQPIEGGSESFDWECAQLKKSTSLTADNTQMDADQQAFVDDIVARGNGYYKTEMPSGYDEGQGAWKRTDLSTVPGGKELFKPNTFFVWAQTGVVGKRQDYVQKVVKFIESTGYSFDEPDVTSAAFETGVLLKDKFPKYKDYFRPDQKIWYVGKVYSGKEQGKVGSVVDKIKADAGAEIKREFCRGGVDVLYDAAFNPTKVYFDSDADLQLVKDYVKRCVSKLEPNAISNILGGSRKKFEYLKANRSGTEGALRFMLGEQKNNLSSLIKKKLVEAKTKKENDTIGKQLIENRLKMIVESIKKQGNIVEKKNLEKVSLEFINELKELNNQGLINETLGDSLKGIFGTGLEAMPQTFFEVIFDKVLTKLGLNDVSLKNELVNSSKNNPTEIVNAFKDCKSMTELIAKTITEILFMNLQSEKNLKGQGWSLIKNVLGQEIKREEFIEKIKSNLSSSVCQEFSNLTSNSQNLLSKIKGSTIQ